MKGERGRLQVKLRRAATAAGVDLFGVADLSHVRDYLRAQGGDAVAWFPKAVSLGVCLPSTIVDGLERHEDKAALHPYQHLYTVVNATLDAAALRVARTLQGEGYAALPVAASQTVFPEKLAGLVSHKLVAHLAGLGWVGKSCLLVTPEYGPRVRLATVLTDAPLTPGSPIDERCGSCRECVDACPVHAFTGAPFNPSEPRESRFKAELCREYTEERAERLGVGLCGLCVYVCPYGRRRHPHPGQPVL